jgi:hypothetical protein
MFHYARFRLCVHLVTTVSHCQKYELRIPHKRLSINKTGNLPVPERVLTELKRLY